MWQTPGLAMFGRWRALAPIAAALGIASPPLLFAQGGVISGQVLAGNHERPIVNAQVQMRPRDFSVRSDSGGRFRIRDVPPGEYVIVVRAIGFDSLLARARVGPNEMIDVDFLLTPLAQTLRPVAVTADGSPNRIRLAEFEERRAEGFGRFLDHVAFERSSASQVDVVLVKLVPGIRAKRLYGKIALESQRDGRSCYPQVVVNGISMYNGVPKDFGKIAEESATFDLNSLKADEIIGFEWHTPSTTPLRYNATGAGSNGSPCGTAIFWTK